MPSVLQSALEHQGSEGGVDARFRSRMKRGGCSQTEGGSNCCLNKGAALFENNSKTRETGRQKFSDRILAERNTP